MCKRSNMHKYGSIDLVYGISSAVQYSDEVLGIFLMIDSCCIVFCILFMVRIYWYRHRLVNIF